MISTSLVRIVAPTGRYPYTTNVSIDNFGRQSSSGRSLLRPAGLPRWLPQAPGPMAPLDSRVILDQEVITQSLKPLVGAASSDCARLQARSMKDSSTAMDWSSAEIFQLWRRSRLGLLRRNDMGAGASRCTMRHLVSRFDMPRADERDIDEIAA
jgi:hypothetical protein